MRTLATVRLAKYLAHAGVASRRACEEIVRSGRVTVDGVVVTDPARAVAAEHAVALDGKPVSPLAERVMYMLNKPAGFISSARDPRGRPTVVALVPSRHRLYPVGRLDADVTGLILLTNDGWLAHRLTHPSFQVPKTYRAVVGGGPVRGAELRALRAGVRLAEGLTAPARVRRLAPDTLELTVHEGRKRQIKRMCEAVGHPVIRLERVRFGPLGLGGLAVGQYRRLSAAEVRALASAGSKARRGPGSSYGVSGSPRRRSPARPARPPGA
jgi:23S rRNA pseudouridine2605 synthase